MCLSVIELLSCDKLLKVFVLKAKRKKPSAPEKPAKKAKSGESSKPGGSSKGSSNGDDNMFQVGATCTSFVFLRLKKYILLLLLSLLFLFPLLLLTSFRCKPQI